MNTYHPDNWVVIKFDGPYPHYRVLAGWSDIYTIGTSWKLNSGITKVEDHNDFYRFYGSSGSYYDCNKESYMLHMNNKHMWNKLKELHGDKVQLMDEDTDWSNVDWIIS